MRIGIFGDSYATNDNTGVSWIERMRQFGHDITGFGAPGSSIVYSARQIEKNHDFDFIIWCMTTPGRFSFKSNITGGYVHTSSIVESVKPLYKSFPEILDALEICKDYQIKVMDYQDEEFVGRCIADSMLNRYPNLMIIPCFPSPLHLGFSLFDITMMGAIHSSFQPGHLLPRDHQILAELINENLNPGYFLTSLDNFT